jgi:hypothetical protein
VSLFPGSCTKWPPLTGRLLVDVGGEKFTVANMTLQIDDAFIREWHPRYDDTEKDEGDYKKLVSTVAQAKGEISEETFRDIWKWKGATRVIRHVKIKQYGTRYAVAFRRAASEPPERKLAALLAPGVKLPGIGAPTGSTLIHFIHPETMPIIDVRTVEVLFEAGFISTKQRDLEHYEEFRKAIDGIRHHCPGWTLRQIDRALFAYHKYKEGLDRRRLCQA